MATLRLLLLCLVLASCAWAQDTITLSDGRVLIGTFDEATGTVTTIKPFKATIPVQKAQIRSIVPITDSVAPTTPATTPAIADASQPTAHQKRLTYTFLLKADEASVDLKALCLYLSGGERGTPPKNPDPSIFRLAMALDKKLALIEREAQEAGVSILTKTGDYPYIVAEWFRPYIKKEFLQDGWVRQKQTWCAKGLAPQDETKK